MPPGSLDDLHDAGHDVVQLDATQPLVDHIGSADAVISILTDRVDWSTLQTGAAGRLRVVADVAAGYDNIDIVAAEELGFGMDVLHTPHRPTGEATLDELLRRSDIVSLHIPLTNETHHLIDAGRLLSMKPTSVLVNTARGAAVDEAALADALHDGTIFGAGIDVFEHEPTIHPRLLTAPNAVLLSHIGSATVATRTAMARMAAASVLAVLDGRHPENLVTDPRNRP